MAKLAQNLTLPQMQTKWASQLNPVLANLLVQGQMLMDQKLNNGVTIVNHKLGRDLIGWFIVGINGAATVYDNQATNQTPQLTLNLTSNAAVTVNLWVF
jgi:hypothetical protein